MKKIKKRALCVLCAALLSGLSVPAAYASDPGAVQTTLYGIGSVSKVFTAAAVLRLADEGRLELDAPLTRYLPEFTMRDPRYALITPRMLLDHSSGLQGSCYKNTLLLGDNDAFGHDSLLLQLSGQRLKDTPGAFSVYCNDGFSLAELLIERVSGTGFSAYLEEAFYRPLGGLRIETPQTSFPREALAPIYRENVRLPPENANVIASGGLYATAEDLCRFAKIFTRAGEPALLSADAVLEAEKPSFAGGVWEDVPEGGAGIAYGLGWDSVNAYPFGSYGIKAVSKGGDTTSYHAALTVLPEENISCAVLSSGGSSGLNGMAVQEILLEYLRETGRIPAESPVPERAGVPDPIPVPAATRRFEGWYISSQQAMHASFEGEDTLILRSSGTRRDTAQRYAHIGGGVFQSTQGAYVSPAGKLIQTQDGTRGETRLSFKTDAQGVPYIMMQTGESMPGLSGSFYDVPFAQRAEPAPLSQALTEKWSARDGARYYLVSEKHTSVRYLQDPSVQPRLIEGLPGYVCLDDAGPSTLLNRIADGNNAFFTQKIPAQAGRDLSDLSFIQKDGYEELNTQNYRFIPEEGVQALGNDLGSVTIGPDGDAQWYSARSEDKNSVRVTAPQNGNFFVYTLGGGEGLTCTASSLGAENGEDMYLPADCRVAFVGAPGATFKIERPRPVRQAG